MEERNIKTACNNIAELHGWLRRSNTSNTGAPDTTYFKNDISFDIEFKSTSRGKKGLSQAQLTYAKTTLKNNQRNIYIISSIDDFQRVLFIFEKIVSFHKIHNSNYEYHKQISDLLVVDLKDSVPE